MKRIIILGCTGSIGKSTISVVRRFTDRLEIVAMSAHIQDDSLLKLGKEFAVDNLCISGKMSSHDNITHHGREGLITMIRETDADIVVNGICGSPGLLPSIAAIESGKSLALANKETIVMAGDLIIQAALHHGVDILPVDSEHAALFQLINNFNRSAIASLILTASGGAFRDAPIGDLRFKRVNDALQHPVWDMGAKITIDSATMANKGLEIIEASRLFGFGPDSIHVALHPQSFVHSMIRTKDGNIYAQISQPDMRVPIQEALSYPETWDGGFAKFNVADASMCFSSWDADRYPLLSIAYQVLQKEGAYPLAYNAANESAVEAFMTEKIGFCDIHSVVAETLERDWQFLLQSYDHIMETDIRVKEEAHTIIKRKIGTQ